MDPIKKPRLRAKERKTITAAKKIPSVRRLIKNIPKKISIKTRMPSPPTIIARANFGTQNKRSNDKKIPRDKPTSSKSFQKV